jgi:hypothetical protein
VTGQWFSAGPPVSSTYKTDHHDICIYIRMDEQNDEVQLPVILRIFDQNQNPVDMHTSIMCINIPKNIKAVAPKP